MNTESDRDNMFLGELLQKEVKGIGSKKVAKLYEVYAPETDDLEIMKQIVATQGAALNSFLTPSQVDSVLTIVAQEIHNGPVGAELHNLLESFPLIEKLIDYYDIDGTARAKASRQALADLLQDPYDVARHVSGFSLVTAESVATKLGIAPNSPKRLQGLILYALAENLRAGHTMSPMNDLIDYVVLRSYKNGAEQFDKAAVRAMIDKMSDVFVVEYDGCEYVQRDYLARMEAVIAEIVSSKSRDYTGAIAKQVQRALDNYENSLSRNGYTFKLDDSQREAIMTLVESRLAVLTGGPGTGKTTTIRALLHVYHDVLGVSYRRIKLLAPTGRAASRMKEAIDFPASTIHSALGLRPGHSEDVHMIDADVVIVDESSMIDTSVMFHLLTHVSTKTIVIFAGDVDQLASVGAGQVFRDMIASSIVPIARLEVSHRQEDDSDILTVARAFRDSDTKLIEYILSNALQNGFWFQGLLPSTTPSIIKPEIVAVRDMYRNLVENNYYTPDAIQLVAAFNDDVKELNCIIQRYHHPNLSLEQTMNGHKCVLAVGDRVINTKNGSKPDLVNGDIGYVTGFEGSGKRRHIRVSFLSASSPDGVIEREFTATEARCLELGYCITVHKSQGGEFPCVIMYAMSGRGYSVLNRNWLYTGVSRAQSQLILMGNPTTFIQGATVVTPKRFTGLQYLL